MVRNTDYTTNIVILVKSTRRICYDNYLKTSKERRIVRKALFSRKPIRSTVTYFDPQATHDINGQHHRLHVMTFVGMKPPTKAHGRDSTEGSKDNFALVPSDGAMGGKTRNVRVFDMENFPLQGIRKTRETRPANYPHLRALESFIFQPVPQISASAAIGFE